MIILLCSENKKHKERLENHFEQLVFHLFNILIH